MISDTCHQSCFILITSIEILLFPSWQTPTSPPIAARAANPPITTSIPFYIYLSILTRPASLLPSHDYSDGTRPGAQTFIDHQSSSISCSGNMFSNISLYRMSQLVGPRVTRNVQEVADIFRDNTKHCYWKAWYIASCGTRI